MPTNDDFGLGIIAESESDLQAFKELCRTNFLPVSTTNCLVSSTCTPTMIDQYLVTGIDSLHLEYAMIILLNNVQHQDLPALSYPQTLTLNKKIYSYSLQVLREDECQSKEELFTKIRTQLLGEQFIDNHHDHASVPTLPSPRQPQFVAISPHSRIACSGMPRRRDLTRFQQEFGLTHVLTLLNADEIKKSNICRLVESAGMTSLHVPIDGAEVSVFTSSKKTADVLIERLPAIRDLLLNSTHEAPVKMLIHCAAGLHRTGTITYLLLRLCHFSADQALLIIHRTRAITARQVAQKRIDAAESHLLGQIPWKMRQR